MVTLEAKNLVKIYHMGTNELKALDDVSLSIKKGEFVAITGTSGSGKSTLMHILGCLDIPNSGQYFIDGKNTTDMTRNELAQIRNEKIGFVFQKFYLLPDLNAIDNVALPMLYSDMPEKDAREKAKKYLKIVDLEERYTHYPYQLSGGQQQRVAIARALANSPSIILADEPTGNLDSATGNTILDLFKKLNKEENVTIILVTHDLKVANHANRIIQLLDGKIISDKATSHQNSNNSDKKEIKKDL